MPDFIPNRFKVNGLQSWQGGRLEQSNPLNGLPSVSKNAFDVNTSRFFDIDWPPGIVLVHPLPSAFVIIGRRSPINGTVDITGGLRDRHPFGTDGVNWSIDKNSVTLVKDAVPEGGAESFGAARNAPALHHVPVRAGDFLYFLVGPGPNSDYTCDSTQLDITISRFPG